MCEHSKRPERVFKPSAAATALAGSFAGSFADSIAETLAGGSRRRRLWELPRHCHCPLIGVCMPMPILRKLMDKVLGGQAVAGDYEMHVGAVSECGVRNKVSEILQRELDRRYTAEIRRFGQVRTTDGVAGLWRKAAEAGDVSAALWAALTHPKCDSVLQEAICRDIHMIQHQAGASARVDMRRVQSLVEENGVLARELGRVQSRSTQWQAERIAECERLNDELVKARGEAMGQETRVANLEADNRRLRQSMPDLRTRLELADRVNELRARARTLEEALDASRREAAALREELAASATAHADATVVQPIACDDEAAAAAAPLPVGARSILCVGGRNSQVPIYRDLVERRGGRFAHHDGGIEDNPHRLDASLAAADLVICQTGCLSHNAYWLVKDHCKRTGKRCVYLESPSVAGFVRGLAQIPPTSSDGV